MHAETGLEHLRHALYQCLARHALRRLRTSTRLDLRHHLARIRRVDPEEDFLLRNGAAGRPQQQRLFARQSVCAGSRFVVGDRDHFVEVARRKDVRDESRADAGNAVRTGGATVRLAAPLAWQPSPEGDRPVAASFRLEDARTITLVADRLDPTLPLVVDPQVAISTEIGGRGADTAAALAVDPTGAVWMAGRTSSSDFPTTEDGDETLAGLDGYLLKIDPQTPEVLIATFLGGTATDFVSDLEIDGSGRSCR